MSTNRKIIRQRIAAALNGKTAAGANVFPSRAKTLFPSELPAILVYTNGENISVFNDAPRELQRKLSVKIEIAAQGSEDEIEDTLDDIAQQIETVMSDEPNQTLGGACGDAVLTRVDTIVEADGEKPSGGCALTYEVTYYTLDVSDEDVLPPFETGNVEYEVVPNTGQPPVAIDPISLKGL